MIIVYLTLSVSVTVYSSYDENTFLASDKTHYPSGSLLYRRFGPFWKNLFIHAFYYKSGQIKSLFFTNGYKMVGRAITFFENGQVCLDSNFRENALCGEVKNYYKSGRLMSKDDYDHGQVITSHTYYESGKVYMKWSRKNSHLIGSTYYESGHLLAEMVMKDVMNVTSIRVFDKTGKPLNGSHRITYESGKIHFIGTYKSGYPNGLVRQYYESGSLAEETEYLGGKPHGIRKVYFETGEWRLEIPYREGKVHGDTKVHDLFYDGGVTVRRYVDGRWVGEDK
jgi:antitoxin component YwqK of YwqJK toxin-antitoxin module